MWALCWEITCQVRACIAAARRASCAQCARQRSHGRATPFTLSTSTQLRPILSGLREFEIFLNRSGSRLQVPPDKSIAQVLRENGVVVETSCEAGTCGTCRTRYLSGDPVHADFVLTETEQREFLMLCCTRASGGVLVLDL